VALLPNLALLDQGAACGGAPDSRRTYRALRPDPRHCARPWRAVLGRGPAAGPTTNGAGRVAANAAISLRNHTRYLGTLAPRRWAAAGVLRFLPQVPGIVLCFLVGMRVPDGRRCAMSHVPPWTPAEPTQRPAECDGERERIRASPTQVESNPHCQSPEQPQTATAMPDHAGASSPAMTHRSSPTHTHPGTDKSPTSGQCPIIGFSSQADT